MILGLVPALYLDPSRFLHAETYALPSVLFDLESRGVAVVGDIPGSLPAFGLPDISGSLVGDLAMTALVITLFDGDENDLHPLAVQALREGSDPVTLSERNTRPEIRFIQLTRDLPLADIYVDGTLGGLARLQRIAARILEYPFDELLTVVPLWVEHGNDQVAHATGATNIGRQKVNAGGHQ